MGASGIWLCPCKLVIRPNGEGVGRDPGRKHRPTADERCFYGGQRSRNALGRACGAGGCEGYRARGRVCAPPTWAEARARSSSFPVLRLIHQLPIGYDRFRQPFARVRVSRSTRAHELDAGARGRCSRAAVHVDVPSPYLCGAHPYSNFRNSCRGCIARCERAATATATAPSAARCWRPRG